MCESARQMTIRHRSRTRLAILSGSACVADVERIERLAVGCLHRQTGQQSQTHVPTVFTYLTGVCWRCGRLQMRVLQHLILARPPSDISRLARRCQSFRRLPVFSGARRVATRCQRLSHAAARCHAMPIRASVQRLLSQFAARQLWSVLFHLPPRLAALCTPAGRVRPGARHWAGQSTSGVWRRGPHGGAAPFSTTKTSGTRRRRTRKSTAMA
jgi:hypothetical protein